MSLKIPTGTKIVKRKELIRRVADRAGYFIYETEDVLLALESVLREILDDGEGVQFGEIFRVAPVLIPPHRYHNPKKLEYGMTDPRIELTVKATQSTQRRLDELVKECDAED